MNLRLMYVSCFVSLFLLFVSISLLLQHFLTSPITDSTIEIILDTRDISPDAILTFKPEQTKSCRFDNCFDISRCEFNRESLVQVYVYPSTEFYSEMNGVRTHLQFNTSLPYKGMIAAIKNSPFYTEDPSRACVFVPPIDTLLDSTNDPLLTSLALSQLPFWNDGTNHLIFSLLPTRPNSLPYVSTHRAIVAGTGLLYSEYRTGFDLSIPAYNFPERLPHPSMDPAESHRDIYLLIILPLEFDTSLETTLEDIQLEDPLRVTTLDFCYEDQRCVAEETEEYPDILLRAKFCLLLTGYRYATPDLLDAMMHGCVPVYMYGNHMLPFEEVLDWRLIGVPIRPAFLPQTISILDRLSASEWRLKQTHSLRIWSRYLSSIESIALTALLVLSDRVFSVQSSTYEDWNVLERDLRRENPLLMLPTPARDTGLTAVIVTQGHLSSLTNLLRILGELRCVNKVIVVWNSGEEIPSQVWSDTVQVVESEGSRFIPLEYVQGECVLSLYDDVTTLTPGEVELGYQAWRQFPDRILGFSAVSHLWNEADTRWEFVSQGKEISLLTGPIFYHSHYQTLLPDYTPEWMDSYYIMCEDIILNFMVSVLTNKSPIKLTQKLDLCNNCEEKLTPEGASRFEIRNKCLNKLVDYFGRMPLRPAKFRVDPFSHTDVYPGNIRPNL